MPANHDYLKSIRSILSEQLGCAENEITAESNLSELGADSLDHIEIIMAIEDEYDIEIDEHDAENVKTVSDIISYLEGHLGNSPA
jgi:acyl carrier protein